MTNTVELIKELEKSIQTVNTLLKEVVNTVVKIEVGKQNNTTKPVNKEEDLYDSIYEYLQSKGEDVKENLLRDLIFVHDIVKVHNGISKSSYLLKGSGTVMFEFDFDKIYDTYKTSYNKKSFNEFLTDLVKDMYNEVGISIVGLDREIETDLNRGAITAYFKCYSCSKEGLIVLYQNYERRREIQKGLYKKPCDC